MQKEMFRFCVSNICLKWLFERPNMIISNSEISQPDRHDDVRNRLLDAAEKLFCQKGFEQTSVRELTVEARCNLAAVNYHFGSKQNLYAAMFRRQFEKMIQVNLDAISLVMSRPEVTLEHLLAAVIGPPIRRVNEGETNTQVMRLLVREVLNKRMDPDYIIRDMKEKMFDCLGRAFKQLVPELPDEKLILIVCGVDGILLHPYLFMELYMKVMPELTVDGLIEHIVRFAAAAIRGYAEGRDKCSK